MQLLFSKCRRAILIQVIFILSSNTVFAAHRLCQVSIDMQTFNLKGTDLVDKVK